MTKIIKFFIALISIVTVFACALATKEENKTVRTRAAQDRINASKSGADIITKELDSTE